MSGTKVSLKDIGDWLSFESEKLNNCEGEVILNSPQQKETVVIGSFSVTHMTESDVEREFPRKDDGGFFDMIQCKHCMAAIKESDTTCTHCGEGQ